MGRPVVLSNGTMMVGLNEQGLVHDFYYPYIGLDNLTNARSMHHKVGVWEDNTFSWLDGEGWNIVVDFEEDALVSNVVATHSGMGLEIVFQDFVDAEHNAFARHITVRNLRNYTRQIRLFMHQVFQISHAGRADTALFVPDGNYLLDYKGRVSLIIYAQTADKKPFEQYCVGNYGVENKEGTYRDAEDGELSNNPVEHGGVDSALRLNLTVNGNATAEADYWITVAASQYEGDKIHDVFLNEGLLGRMDVTRRHWHKWLEIGAEALQETNPKYRPIAKKSMMLIKAHTDRRGGVLASGDSSIFNYGRDYYCYCWPRDGAYAMWPLIRLGYTDEPRRFFEFCRDVLSTDGYLEHKYQPDRAIGSTWHPLLHNNRRELAIQEDETALVLYMLGEYLESSKDEDFVHSLYETFVQPAANFLATYIDDSSDLPHASYDLWEEKFLSSTYTAFLTQAALRVGSRFAEKFDYPDDAITWKDAAHRIYDHISTYFDDVKGYYVKGFLLDQYKQPQFDTTLDASSVYGALMFSHGPLDHDKINASINALVTTLYAKGPGGGMARYENDTYMRTGDKYPGNPWIICTLWLAQYYVLQKEFDKAHQIVDWTLARAHHSGALAEQIDSDTGASIGVMPLVWSHAELLNTILDLANQ